MTRPISMAMVRSKITVRKKVFDFVVDLGEVVADDAEAEHEQCAGEELQQDDRGEAFERFACKIAE